MTFFSSRVIGCPTFEATCVTVVAMLSPWG